MRKILIASHGRVASGVKSAMGILLGDVSTVTAVDCYMDETDFTPAIEEFIAAVGPSDEAVIFTDLQGGSVCNKVMTLQPEEHGAIHVTGFNLVTVIGCFLSGQPLTPEVVDEIVAEGSGQMRRICAETTAAADDEGDFFA